MKKLDIEQAEKLRKKFASDWEIRKGLYLYKKVALDDYNQVLRFLMAVEKPQIKLDHFADFMNFYNELTIGITTHDVNGLTELDFELALYIDKALEQMGARQLDEKWSAKYKKSINCSNPKGFSQKAHCAGRKKKESIEEGFKLQLERDTDVDVLHIVNTDTGGRTEVRGKKGYESGNYDPNDKLHQLLDRVGKSANISDLMNGEVVGINPKHPDATKAKAATSTAFNEALDNPYPFKLSGPSDSQGFVATAQTPNGTLRMDIETTDYDNFGIDFAVGKSMGKTQAGDEFRVFATVVAMMKKWINTVGIEHVESFDFGANKDEHASDGRAKLYARFAKKLASQLGWKLEQSTTANRSHAFFKLTNPKPVPRDDEYWDALEENFAKDSITSIKLIKKYQQTGKDEDAFAAIKHGWNFIKNPKMRSMIVNLVKKVSTENGYPEWNDTVAYIKKNTGIDVSNVNENFADGKKKGKSRPGRVKRAGASCNGSVTALRKRAKNASGEKAKMLRWCANMKSGRQKKKGK